MGGFAGLVGHAAGGFEQAHQEDIQRQFADLAQRRSQAGEFLSQLALDPNQHEDVRQIAMQARLGLLQEKPNKDFNFGKTFEPVFNKMAQVRQQQAVAANASPLTTPGTPLNMPPAPPPELATIMQGGTHAQALPAGVAGPPQQVPNVPQINAPPRQLAMASPAVQGPPVPLPTLLAGIPEIAQNVGTIAGAQAGGTMQGQIAARQQYLNQLPDIPPEMKAVLGLGGSMMPFVRQVGSGAGYAKDLRAQGFDVPDDIKDDQYVKATKLGSGQTTYIPAPAPGEKAGGGGSLINPLQLAQGQANIRYGIWSKENKTRFGQQLALQNNAFNLALQRGYYGDADKIFTGAVKDYQLGINRMRTMDTNLADALKTGSQQAQVSLVMNHIGMTAGAQPGMRMARATIEEAIQSAPWMQNVVKKWFHQDETGDYVFDGPKGGINLSKPQMEQMVELAHQKVNVLHDTVGAYQEGLNPATMEFQAPGMQAAGAGATPKPRGGGPPKPKSTTKDNDPLGIR